MNLALCARSLTKSYKGKPVVHAVRGIDLDIRSGECFGLLGPNGAGKTTTLEMLEGLTEPTDGSIEVFSQSWKTHANQIRPMLGITLQETRFMDDLSVLETVRLFRSFYATGIEPQEALETVSLQEKCNAKVEQLSGGQLQRLAIATAIVGDPKLLFLDEPTTGLDPQSRRELWDVVRKFRAMGKTIVLTTHYMDEAEQLCDRIAIIDYGKIIALGTPKDLIDKHGGQQIIEFVLASGNTPLDESALLEVASVQQVHIDAERYRLWVVEPIKAIQSLLRVCENSKREIAEVSSHRATLEDAFINLTGRQLREDSQS